MKYPDNITSGRAKAAYFVFSHLYRFDTGRGTVVGRFTSVFMEIGMLLLILKSYNVELTPTMYVVGFVVLANAFYILGHFYLKLNLDKVDLLVHTERNPILNDVHKSVAIKKEEY